jgi:hypothetical protein
MKKGFNILWVLIGGLLFLLFCWSNYLQLHQIPREPIWIELGDEKAGEEIRSKFLNYTTWGAIGIPGHQKQGASLVPSLPKREDYSLTIKAFASTPPDMPNRSMEIRFNGLALGGFEFRKASEWQKFRLLIPANFVSEEKNTLELIFPKSVSFFPVVLKYIKFKPYFFRVHNGINLYCLFDSSYVAKERVLSFSRLFITVCIVFLCIFLLHYCSAYFIAARRKLEFTRACRLDLFTYLPSLGIFFFLLIFSFFSRYYIVYSLFSFFILSLLPTLLFKAWFAYSTQIIKFVSWMVKTLLSIPRLIVLFIRDRITSLPRFILLLTGKGPASLIDYHRHDLASALILDAIPLLLLCALILMLSTYLGEDSAPEFAEQIANLAYFLLLGGVIMKIVRYFHDRSKKD